MIHHYIGSTAASLAKRAVSPDAGNGTNYQLPGWAMLTIAVTVIVFIPAFLFVSVLASRRGEV